MQLNSLVNFSVDIKGNVTGRQYSGLFTAKTKLTQREILKQDEIRRTILGTNPDGAPDYIQRIAQAVSYLSVTIQHATAQSWWKESDSGLELEDQNVLAEVNNKCLVAVEAEYARLAKEANKAQEDLTAAKKE